MERIDYIAKLTNIKMEKLRIQQYVDNGYISKEQAYDFLIEGIDSYSIGHKYTREKMEENIFKHNANANEEVIQFILDFIWSLGDYPVIQENIIKLFNSGYCYYFAEMLKTAFNRGEVCWCAPFGHICWVDDDGIPYDIEGVCISECEYYIPISYIKDGIADFMHVTGKSFNASKEYIDNAIERYKKDMNDKDV